MSRNFTKNQKVVIAMSGGVDSSVAAALLKEQGHDLIGVTLNLSCSTKSSDRSCCSASAALDAKKVADKLGIPHYVLNLKEEFQKYVIDNFIEEYQNGRTPNPCIRCNQFIKFDLLLKKVKELGAEYLATGHYARRVSLSPLSPLPQGEGNKRGEGFKLLKGKDVKKDQSYVLYMMTQESLAQTLFPLGNLTKKEVRKIAKNLDLPVAEKEESQEICFVEDNDYGKFLKDFYPQVIKPGPILDKQGNLVGMHGGIAFYTIGQRKGIGAHRGNPKYVIEIDRQKNTLIIGNQEDVFTDELIANRVNFVAEEFPQEPLTISAKIRYNSPQAKAIVFPLDKKMVKVQFEKPQRAVTPGQAVVFYRGEEVVGGGVIG